MTDDRHKVLALALAHCGATDDALADLVPDACWNRLHEEGLLRLSADAPGDDPVSAPTEKGREWLRDTLAGPLVQLFAAANELNRRIATCYRQTGCNRCGAPSGERCCAMPRGWHPELPARGRILQSPHRERIRAAGIALR